MRRVSWKRQDEHEGRRQECRRRFGKKIDIHKPNNCGLDLKIKMVTCNLTCLKIPTLKSLIVHRISKMGVQEYGGIPNFLWIVWVLMGYGCEQRRKNKSF